MTKVENTPRYTKWYSLYDKVFLEGNLRAAFQHVKRRKGAGGIDRMTIEQFERHSDRHLAELSRILRQKTYRPLPVRRVHIPKPDGTARPLGIPAIRDRVVQQSVTSVLEPIFEPTFHPASYGFRPNRSPHAAIAAIEQHLKEGYQWVVDADIQDFFGTIDHKLLLKDVNDKIADGSALNLIDLFLNAGVMEEGRMTHTTTGTPQGGVVSPLLSNIYLNGFDWEMAGKGYRMVRYCDDWVILTKTREEAERALQDATEYLARKHLTLKSEKTRIVHHTEGFEFLGFWFKDYDGVHRKGPRTRAIEGYKDKIRHATRRNQPRNIRMLAEKLSPITWGWGLYFGIGDVTKRFAALDGWTRSRLRSFLEKKRSTSLQMHTKYRNQYFHDLGFVFLSDLITSSSPAMGQRYR